MTLTIALIVNGALVAVLFVALFLVMRIPFVIDRPLRPGRSARREPGRSVESVEQLRGRLAAAVHDHG